MVQAQNAVMYPPQAVAQNECLGWKKGLWRENGRKQLEFFPWAPWASRRRREVLELLDRLNRTIAEGKPGSRARCRKVPRGERWMTHPRVGASPPWSS